MANVTSYPLRTFIIDSLDLLTSSFGRLFSISKSIWLPNNNRFDQLIFKAFKSVKLYNKFPFQKLLSNLAGISFFLIREVFKRSSPTPTLLKSILGLLKVSDPAQFSSLSGKYKYTLQKNIVPDRLAFDVIYFVSSFFPRLIINENAVFVLLFPIAKVLSIRSMFLYITLLGIVLLKKPSIVNKITKKSRYICHSKQVAVQENFGRHFKI